ncbi:MULTISPECIES: OmpA family protein [unclassified Agarivorans]|uniref:OmpA family protein n=1 Tax=unclassified Agarivorans TaxID=2636026 RepID=UPI003D7C544C
MKNKIVVVMALLGIATLSGCSNAPKGDAGIICPAIGGGLGALIGGGAGAVGGVITGAMFCANPDQDGDGVINSQDECPDTPAGTVVDERGCAAVEEAVVEQAVVEEAVVVEQVAVVAAAAVLIPEGCEQYVMVDGDKVMGFKHVLFGFNKDKYSQAEQAKVDCIADTIMANDLTIDAVGYTDSVGNADYNMALSQRRANNVADALRASGVSASTTIEKGKGAAAPVASNATEAGRADNRRVEVRVYH